MPAKLPPLDIRYRRLTSFSEVGLETPLRSWYATPRLAQDFRQRDRGSRSALHSAGEASPFAIEVKDLLVLLIDHADRPVPQRPEDAIPLQILTPMPLS